SHDALRPSPSELSRALHGLWEPRHCSSRSSLRSRPADQGRFPGPFMTPADIRSDLVKALRLDLVGPGEAPGNEAEVLPEPPSRWYLTGFLVPFDADESQRSEEMAADEMDQVEKPGGIDDSTTPDSAASRRSFFPSSIGLSFLVPAGTKKLRVKACWGDYKPQRADNTFHWHRTGNAKDLLLDVPAETTHPAEKDVPDSKGLRVALSVRPIQTDGKDGGIPKGTRAVSVFLINRRAPTPDEVRDEAWAFQARLEVGCDDGFVPRPNLRSLQSNDWDERVADLQYRDVCEYAVGHSVSTDACMDCGTCKEIHTCWIPDAEVERVAPAKIGSVELSMEALAELASPDDAEARLSPLVEQYKAWITLQQHQVPATPKKRKETGEELLKRAGNAARRIEQGIALLKDKDCFEAFLIANRVMAAAGKRRLGTFQGKDPAAVQPEWRPFQLAFILMNLPGIADGKHLDREMVDLLFFPTGGGKTEAYLGLAAFTLVHRRLENPGITSAGL